MPLFPSAERGGGEERAKKSIPQRSNYLEMIKQSSQKFIQRLQRDSGAKKKNRIFDFLSYSLLSTDIFALKCQLAPDSKQHSSNSMTPGFFCMLEFRRRHMSQKEIDSMYILKEKRGFKDLRNFVNFIPPSEAEISEKVDLQHLISHKPCYKRLNMPTGVLV